MALILRNGGSQSPDRWLKEPRNNHTTLEAICNGFGITLSQFFAEDEMVELTPELKNLFDKWISLTPEQKDAVYSMVNAFNNS